MRIQCTGCKRGIDVPDDRAQNADLKIKCRCGTIFRLAEARRAVAPPTAPAAPPREAGSGSAQATRVEGRPAPTRSVPPPLPATASSPPRTHSPAAPPAPATVPTLVPQSAMSVTAPAAAATMTATAAAAAIAVPRGPAAPSRFRPSPHGADPLPVARGGFSSWRRCATHTDRASDAVCPACGLGWCGECGTAVRTAILCPQCEGLCVRSSDFEERDTRERQRATSLLSEIPTILHYPLTDPMALVLLALVVWIFTVMRYLNFGFIGAGASLLFSKGLLMAYAFNAILKVSNGQMRGFMPEISDITDLIVPLRQSFAAVVASWWLVGVALLLAPGILGMGGPSLFGSRDPTPVVHAQAYDDDGSDDADLGSYGDEESAATPDPVDAFLSEAQSAMEGQPIESMDAEALPPSEVSLGSLAARSAGVVFLLLLGVLWGVAYSPIALIVAVLTRDEGMIMGVLQTLNPWIGVHAVLRMGSTYWQALAVYLLIVVGELIIGVAVGWIPILGGMILAAVSCYAYLAIGCTLGLAIFKKARALDLD